MKAKDTRLKFLVAVVLLAGLLPLFLITTISIYGFASGPLPGNSEVALVISPDSSFRTITAKLADAKVITPDIRFRLLAGFMGVTGRLRAGEYIFKGGQNPYQVLRLLHQGSMVQRALTIPEGATLQQIAAILDHGGWVKKNQFLKLCKSREFISGLDLSVDSLEGYLFPDTYFFERGGVSPEKIITTMVLRMREILSEIREEHDNLNGFDLHKLLTLASIVEKETAQPDERPLIARVFLNRLKKGMKLQTDPTVIYGIENFNGNLTRSDLQTPTPYNTYLFKGLPPGPIGNPGKAAILSVLNPAQGAYYYFVSKNDGSHYFSKTLSEHNQAVARFQKRLYSRK
ncbi:MAG: endolytic transglycosylase MltG [Proteobacteria bacterium]|nr:endolytic transglycosylase MltG [Pseudomonadota bacterium]MBU1737270.1 endolytic transglycosylase MltG [Pseudomonadota bacterium]